MSAPNAAGLPEHGRHEIAVVGRSNVGKSSLLGRLLGAPSIVRTSRTPGRTQLLNLFALGDEWAFVDLPGYGYAKLSHGARNTLQAMIADYLYGPRRPLGILLLLDGRRDEVVAKDHEMVQRLMEHGHTVLIVLTKCDLLPKTSRQTHISRLGRSLGVPASWMVATSTKTGLGLDEVWSRLHELVREHEQQQQELTEGQELAPDEEQAHQQGSGQQSTAFRRP